MSGSPNEESELRRHHRLAIAQWDTEGGAGPCGPQESTAVGTARSAIPDLANTELVQLRVRVIALENLLVALLSGASVSQLKAASDMAELILPRPAAHPHPLTIRAAAHMQHLLANSAHLKATDPC